MLYLILKFVHIFLAIIAIGANITYGIWISRASRQPEVLPFTLKVIKLIDDRVANPAYGFLLITGLWMMFAADLPLSTPWLHISLALYVLLMLLGLFGYTPTLKKQIKLLESEGVGSPAYQSMARRGKIIGILVAVLVLVILYLMVMKPAFRG